MPKPAWTSYRDFALKIERTETGEYRVEAQGPSGGEAESTFTLPFDEKDLTILLLQVGRPRSTTSRGRIPEPVQPTVDFGKRLFEAVFNGSVKDLFKESLLIAKAEEAGLRLRLRLVGVPDLADWPWEFLHDGREFLALSHDYSLVRYNDLPVAPRPLEGGLPLRILATVSSPKNLEPLDVEREKKVIRESLDKLITAGKVELDFTQDATLSELRNSLSDAKSKPYHVWHFIGHASYDPDNKASALEMCDETGYSFQVGGMQLATVFRSYPEVRLVLLNACEGGRSGQEDPFAGVAGALVECGIPAVVGMQFEISDKAAIAFAEEFYDSVLVKRLPLDAAMTEARLAIFCLPNWVEWATPLLFMRSPNGVLFDTQAMPQPAATPSPPVQVLAPAAEKGPEWQPEATPSAIPPGQPASLGQPAGTQKVARPPAPASGAPPSRSTAAPGPVPAQPAAMSLANRFPALGSLPLPIVIGGGLVLLVALCAGLSLLAWNLFGGGKSTETSTPTEPGIVFVTAESSTRTPTPPTSSATPSIHLTLTATETPTASPSHTPTPTATETAATPTLATPFVPADAGGGGGLIAFVSDRSGSREIYKMEKTGWSNPEKLTGFDRVKYPPPYEYPAWSWNGKRLAFISGYRHLNLINPNGSGFLNLVTLDNTKYKMSDPAWSPDQTQILFTRQDVKPSSEKVSSEICFVRVRDGMVSCPIDNTTTIDMQAVYDPDGQRIAFASNRDGDFEIFTIDADSFNENSLIQLTFNGNKMGDIHPTWSADGERLYYMTDIEQDDTKPTAYEPWVMNVDGSALQKVPGFQTSANSFYYLAWSPDRKYVLYAWGTKVNSTLEIYLALADGTLLRKLTENTSLDANPVWQP